MKFEDDKMGDFRLKRMKKSSFFLKRRDLKENEKKTSREKENAYLC